MANVTGTIVVAFLIVYFVITVAISLIARRRASAGILQFLIAGKQMPWWIIALSAFATYEGASSFLGWPGIAWKNGLVVAWQIYPTSLGVLAFSIFIIPILAKMRRITLPEAFGDRYGTGVRTIVAVLSYSRLLGGGAIMLLGIADTFKTFLGLSIVQGLGVALLMMGIYTIISGQYGVMYSDAFQAIFTMVSAVGAPIVLLLAIGHGSIGSGWSTVLAKVPTKNFNFMGGSGFTSTVILGYISIWFFSQILRPELYGRIFSARSSKDGMLGWLIFASIVPFQQSGLLLGGLISRVVVSKLSSPDLAMPTALGKVAPWFAAIYAVGIISACTAVAAASFLGAASIYITDFHIRFINRNLAQARAVLYTRVAIIVFALVSAFWAFENKNIINIISQALTILVGGVLVPFLGMFFWGRLNTAGAYASTLVGGVTAVIFTFFLPKVNPLNLPAILFAVLLSLVAAVIATYAAQPQYEHVYHFADIYGLAALKARVSKALGSPVPAATKVAD